METCPKCRKPRGAGPQCEHCGLYFAKWKRRQGSFKVHDTRVKNEQRGALNIGLGLAGAALLLVGVVAPFISLPMGGSQNYIDFVEIDGYVVLAMAIVAAFGVLLRWWFVVGTAGVISLLMVGYSFFTFQSRKSGVLADARSELEGNPFAGLVEVSIGAVSLSWGVALLVIGSALLIGAAFLKQTSR